MSSGKGSAEEGEATPNVPEGGAGGGPFTTGYGLGQIIRGFERGGESREGRGGEEVR